MPTLALFRHAKAAPASDQADFDRPLTDRGRRNAAAMGAVLASYRPETALVSSALRTRETWEIAAAGLKPPASLLMERGLYLCSPGALIARLRELPASVQSAVVVGHNPGMQEAAIWLAGNTDSDAARAMRQKFPTAALAVFDIRVSAWAALAPRSAKLERFGTPRTEAES